MTTQAVSLNSVLRCEMTAVNQQFIHVLALREWGDKENAACIMQVDYVDFPNAMRIIDYLVETATPIVLAPDPFVPGANLRQILIAEQTMEQRLCATIEEATCEDPRARTLIETAKRPRESYFKWLADRLNEEIPDNAKEFQAGTGTRNLVAHLIALIEQPMVHAFLHWHGGDSKSADAAWATSGAAMMYVTEFVRLFAAHQSVPVPGVFPASRIAVRREDALESDRRLAKLCEHEAATVAVGCGQIAIADLCQEIADYCSELSRWSPERPHPAASVNPAAFSSFEATLKKFVR